MQIVYRRQQNFSFIISGLPTWGTDRRFRFVWVFPHVILMLSREQIFWLWHQSGESPKTELSPVWNCTLAFSCTAGSEQLPTKYCHSIPFLAAPGTYSSAWIKQSPFIKDNSREKQRDNVHFTHWPNLTPNYRRSSLSCTLTAACSTLWMSNMRHV